MTPPGPCRSVVHPQPKIKAKVLALTCNKAIHRKFQYILYEQAPGHPFTQLSIHTAIHSYSYQLTPLATFTMSTPTQSTLAARQYHNKPNPKSRPAFPITWQFSLSSVQRQYTVSLSPVQGQYADLPPQPSRRVMLRIRRDWIFFMWAANNIFAWTERE